MKYLSLKKYEYINHGKSNEEYLRRFNSDHSIKIGVNVGTDPAFFVLTREIQDKAILIYKLDKEVLNLCHYLPVEALANYLVNCLTEEIQSTNSIEGVHSTKKEIVDAYYKRGDRFNGIVGKYKLMMSDGNLQLISCQDIRSLYNDLVLPEVQEESSESIPDGKLFRKGHTYVRGVRIDPVHEGLYPEEKIIDSMTGALNFLNNENEEILYRVAVFHYLLGYIHPFYDGNGRLNRFISSYMLTRELETIIGYNLSSTIKENLSLYNKAFVECNDKANRGELTIFVDMFLDILVESIQSLISALETRSNSWDHYKTGIDKLPFADKKSMSKLYKALVLNELFAQNKIDILTFKEQTGLSDPTLRKQLKLFDEAGLLITDSAGRRYQYGIDLVKMDQFIG